MIYPGSGNKTSRVNIIDTINDVSSTLNNVADNVTALETTINSLDNTYVTKTAYNSFVSSTNSSISTINTALENCAKTNIANTFSEENTFEKTIVAQDGVNVTSGDIVVSEGVITFEDLIDGTVVERSGATGYQYIEGMPTSFNNGVCYDIGEISSTTDLSDVKFNSENLVQTCELWFKTPATAPTTHQWPYGNDLYWIDSADGSAPILIASKNYRIVLRREPNKIIASIAYLY